MDNPIKASEHTDITENNNSWTKLLKFIKENGAIFTIVTTLITVVATHAFKLCVYGFIKADMTFLISQANLLK